MRGNVGHWTVAILIFFNVAALGVATVTKYNLASQENESFQTNKSKLSCAETFSGSIKVEKSVEEAKRIVSLEYSVDGKSDEQAVQPNDGSYNIRVFGRPTTSEIWTLRAYYYDKTGQLSETAQQFENVGCDQDITADLELK